MPNLREPNGLKKGRGLDDLEHKSLDEADYKPRLKEQQLKLLELTRTLSETQRTLTVVFEGPDAAGNDGIRIAGRHRRARATANGKFEA